MDRVLSAVWLMMAMSAGIATAQVPPPAEFVDPQSRTLSAPFPTRLVDQGTFDPRLKGLLAPEGIKTEIVADAPTVINPVAMTFAPDGTLFVAEWRADPVHNAWFEFAETFRYRDGTTRKVATMKKFTFDPIKVLKRNPKTGIYDSFEPIIVEELPSTLLYHDGWLYTASRGSVRRYRQSRPGGKWDVRETIAQGFCGFHHHQVSGLTIGNDGLLYITSGDDDNYAEGSDGSRATALRTGAVFRCRLDGSHLELYSLGYRNPYRDLAHDDKFNWFHADNDNEDGSKFTGCRLVHVAEGVDYGWRLRTGARCCRPDNTRGAVAGELPGKLPPMLKTGRGSPAGLLIYNDTAFPERFRNLLYYPDVFRKLTRAYQVEEHGSSFRTIHEFEFLKSEDPLFRPCQMVTGPDGAMYVCDWRTDSGGAGKLWGDGVHGRIYRLTWAGDATDPAIHPRPMDSWAKLLKLSDAELVDALGSPEMSFRLLARNELIRRGPQTRDLVLARFAADTISDHARFVGMGVMQVAWNPAVADLFRTLLQDPSPDIRRLAADGLGLHTQKPATAVQEALLKALGDEHPAVRRSAALAIARIGSEGAADLLISAWRGNDLLDPFLTDAYLRGLEQLGKTGMDALITLAQSGDKVEIARVVSAFVALRTRDAANGLQQLLQMPHLTPEQRATLIRSYPNYLLDPPLSLEPLAEFLADRPNETAPVQVAALEVLAATDSLTQPQATALTLHLMDSHNADVRLAAIDAAQAARLAPAEPLLLKILATPTRDVTERVAALKALQTLGSHKSEKALTDLLAKREPADLKREALRALATVSPATARKVAEQLLDQPDPGLIGEAVIVLGNTKEGAILIGKRYLDKKLPRDLFPRVSEALRKFAHDKDVAGLNTEVMRGALSLALDPARAEKIRQEVQTRGNATRGKELYLNTKLLACVSCHRMEGVGGEVGPDLTRIWDTHTTEKILESIVHPSKEIKEGYQSYKLATLDGRVLTGLRVSDTPAGVTIREANGRDVTVKKDDIDELTVLPTSLMPDNAIAQLSYDQFLDLLAFLKSRVTQESLRGAVLAYQVTFGTPADFAKPGPLETSPNPLTVKLPAGRTWLPAATETGGLLAWKPLAPPEPSAAYALCFVFSPKPQQVTLSVLTDDPFQAWVGGKLAWERPGPKTKSLLEIETGTVALSAGWTPILMKLLPRGGFHKLGMNISGTGLRIATQPEK
ncbi:MAG: HEAT repeat domain-containing protein [Bacteroidales bacterium]|nr:HEAT repeat domain-containing protein [Bacteroidales bacterium]